MTNDLATEAWWIHSLRNDFPSFVRRCFQTLNPGAPFLANWHLAAIAYQLDLCNAAKSPADHQPAAALPQIADGLGGVSGLLVGP